jgi:hypothetical protein
MKCSDCKRDLTEADIVVCERCMDKWIGQITPDILSVNEMLRGRLDEAKCLLRAMRVLVESSVGADAHAAGTETEFVLAKSRAFIAR